MLLSELGITALDLVLPRSTTIPAVLVEPKPLWPAGANPGLKNDIHDQASPVGNIDADPWAIGIFPAMSHLNGLALRFQVARELSKCLFRLISQVFTSLLILRDEVILPALLALRGVVRRLVLLADNISDVFLPSIRIGQQSLPFSVLVRESDRWTPLSVHQVQGGKGTKSFTFLIFTGPGME